MGQPSPWWDSARHEDRRPFLLARNKIVASLRNWFTEREFVEVDTGILQMSPGNETHLHAMACEVQSSSREKSPRYLRTSPEFAAKKLLAAGETKIVEFAKVFRNRERGDLHLPEFTMLEWYRAHEGYESVMSDCIDMIATAARAANATSFLFRGRVADPFAEPEIIGVHDAFSRYAEIDLLATIDDNGEGDRTALAKAASSRLRVTDDDTWSDIFSKVLVEYVEPKLGQGRVTVLKEYPAPEAALARVSSNDPRVAERFEVYACGVELANGFGELIDPKEQRRRFTRAMDEKLKRYGERYPLDEDFLAAMEKMPPASGVALGLDRLVMLASRATRIDQVVWTPPAGGS